MPTTVDQALYTVLNAHSGLLPQKRDEWRACSADASRAGSSRQRDTHPSLLPFMSTDPILLTLDQPREIRWSLRAEARLSSVGLDFATAVSRLNRRQGLYALCALVWAALVDRDQPFATPEDLAEHLPGPTEQTAALAALRTAATAAGLLKEAPKKNAPGVSKPAAGPGSRSR